MDLKTLECSVNVLKHDERYTIKPGYGNCLKEDEEEKRHPTGWVVVKQLEHIQATLKENMNPDTYTVCTHPKVMILCDIPFNDER